jgi:pimeloyl-ACP methyl ester carboxylesterase
MQNLPVLFLSGAGFPPWIWDEVRSTLDVASAVAPSARPDGTLDDYARAALDAAGDWPSCHVVAHSIGGVVAAALVARAPERIGAVTAVCAVVPRAGASFVGSLPRPQRYVMAAMVRLLGTRPPGSVIRSTAAGVDASTADRVVAEFEPESRRLYLDPAPTHTWPADVAYAQTTEDREFPAAVQEGYAAVLGAAVRPIATGHLPMLQDPRRLAELIAG